MVYYLTVVDPISGQTFWGVWILHVGHVFGTGTRKVTSYLILVYKRWTRFQVGSFLRCVFLRGTSRLISDPLLYPLSI